MSKLLRTPLYNWHLAHGGRLVNFAGWSMPLEYSSIIEEHKATRQACGLTDVSHMGRLRFEGPGARAFLDRTLTRRVDDLQLGQLRYSLVTNDQGGILDDVVVGCFPGELGDPVFLVVVNAANRQKILEWVRLRLPDDGEIVVSDLTTIWAMFALQGPRSGEVLRSLVDFEIQKLRRFRGAVVPLRHPARNGCRAIISRTGYTGEDGFEIIVPHGIALAVWEAIMESGEGFGIKPVGLGARDTLRLEAALPLYGQELSAEVNPIEAGLEFACDLEARDFPGAQRIREVMAAGSSRKLVCLASCGRRIARNGHVIVYGNKVVGTITSGTWSPTLERPIAMGYVERPFAAVGTLLEIEVRGHREPAEVVPRPFYRGAHPHIA